MSLGERVEKVLGSIENGFALCYSSGVSAQWAALNYFQPKRIAIGKGYHGSHLVLNYFKRLSIETVFVFIDSLDYSSS